MAVLLLEINEATDHFIDTFVAAGKLPNFARLKSEGAVLHSDIPDVDERDPRFTRSTSPWIVWPSIYTGMRPSEHGLIGFGQDTVHVVGKYLWDVLERADLSYGVFGSLMSFPPRREARFYIPESLASAPDCVPDALQPLQEFLLFGAHHYTEDRWAEIARAGSGFIRALGRAVSLDAGVQAAGQLWRELWGGAVAKANRAMLHSILSFDAFSRLYARHRPDFATAHFNHIAYYQHRYWRAAEPHRFKPVLSSTDKRFYTDVADRERDEARYAHTVEHAYQWTDRILGEAMSLLADGDTLLIASGLGQRPYDPTFEIHNPVVRFDNAERFFARLGLTDIVVRYEMNPDITIDCPDEARAAACQEMIEGLRWSDDGTKVFYCQHRRRQLFLELVVPPHVQHDPAITIRHPARPDLAEPAREYVWQSQINEQSTAHHDATGLVMAWRKGGRMAPARETVLITEIAPAILELLGVAAQDWHRDYAGPVFAL